MASELWHTTSQWRELGNVCSKSCCLFHRSSMHKPTQTSFPLICLLHLISDRIFHILCLSVHRHHCLASNCGHIKLQIEPQLLSGKNVMIAAHGNSLRSIIMYLDKLTSQEVLRFPPFCCMSLLIAKKKYYNI